jgi:hypothetical protein
VTTGILDWLSGPGSTLDANLARIAITKLQQELLAGAKTFEDVEQVLKSTVERVQVAGLLIQYYGHYLFERFSRDFHERLVKSVGLEKARQSVESVRRTIFASLRAKLAGSSPTDIDWRGSEGQQLAETILVETLAIFEAGQ